MKLFLKFISYYYEKDAEISLFRSSIFCTLIVLDKNFDKFAGALAASMLLPSSFSGRNEQLNYVPVNFFHDVITVLP